MSPQTSKSPSAGDGGHRANRRGERSCRSCGTALSVYNDEVRCAPCVSLTRGVPVELNEYRVPPERFLDPDVVRRLQGGDWTVLIDLTKTMTGVQTRIVERASELANGASQVSQSTISRLFNGQTKDPTIRTLRACSDVLGIPAELVGLAPRYTRAPEEADATNRRQFLGFGLGTGMALALPDLTHRLSPSDIESELKALRETAPKLLAQNDLIGGARGLRDIAEHLYLRADALIQHALPGASTGAELQSIAGQFAMYAGWLHYDAGNQPQAKAHWQQAAYHARLADDLMLEVYALESLSAQATYFLERPQEGVALAQKAQEVAAGWAPQRLRSLLQMREAAGWAWAKNRSQFERVYTRASKLFTPTVSSDDPDWLNFYIKAELEGLRAIGYMTLGDGATAEVQVRRMVGSIDPQFVRNKLYYTSILSRIVAEQGDLASAGELLSPSLQELAETGSWRTHRHVRVVLDHAQSSQTRRGRSIVEMARVYGLSPSNAKETS